MPWLRVRFTAADLERTRVAGPDPVCELLLSLHRLRDPAPGPAEVERWRAGVLARRAGTPRFAGALRCRKPSAAGELAALSSAERQRLGRALAELTAAPPEPAASPEPSPEPGLRGYFAAALAPVWPAVCEQVGAERARLAELLAADGAEAMLAALGPAARWQGREKTLESPHPHDRDVRLSGRGLTVVPSWFCPRDTVALTDSADPVLACPLPRTPAPAEAIAKLIGGNRADILAAITAGTSTAFLQRRLGVSASQLSRHAAVLRDSQLITEVRRAGRAFYTRTALGDALVRAGSAD
jgi:DNA-binding transcriptional ArsR family regulator